jgi:general secretion pathway protein L
MMAIGTLRLASAVEMGRSFLQWWLGELRQTAKPVLGLFADGRRPLNLRVTPTEILVAEPSGASLARLPIDQAGAAPAQAPELILQRPAVLVLPRERVLRRTIELPLAAERELEAALSFEIDRQTPFARDRVYHSACTRSRDTARKVIRVELAVAPKSGVDAALAAVEAYGLAPGRVTVEGDEADDAFNFLPRHRASRSSSWRTEPWKAIVAAAAILLVLGSGAYAWRLHQEAKTLENKVAGLHELSRRSQAVRDAIASATTAARFLPEKEAAPRAIEIVDTLSRVLPDDAWIFDLEVTEGQVGVTGFSTDVPALIERLQHEPLFEAPQLRAPVIHGTGKKGDRFDLVVAVKRATP